MKEGAQREPRTSQIAIFRKGWPFRRATLYLYLEGDPSLGEEALAEAAGEAGRQWQRSRHSTTAALQEAAAAGLQALARHGGVRIARAGISCSILQQGGAYLAQAGATRAYILGPRLCRRVAPSSPWDPSQIDVHHQPLPSGGMLLLAPSVLEGALPLLQGRLPPREVQRLIRAWLRDKPRLSALLVALEDGREVALEAGAQSKPQDEEEPPPRPDTGGRRGVTPLASTLPVAEPERGLPQEPAFPILRALRLPLLAVAVLLALVILGGTAWYLPSRQKGQDEVRLAALLEEAGQARREALLYSDVALARRILAQAESLVREAASLRPKDRRVTSLRQEIDGDLDRANSVVRLTSTSLLSDLSKQGGNQSSPSRILMDGNNLYVLDKGMGRVYKFLLDQGGQSLLISPNNILTRKGDLHGGVPLADLWEVFSMPPGPLRPGGSLLILDSQGTLLDYRPERGLQALPLRGVQGWASFKGARGYGGNLYVLDPASDQVWRYIPTSTGYDSEARGILEGAQIRDGVDLAVDGNLYVLTAGGAVWKFGGGPPLAFPQGKMDRPLASPAALFASPATRHVYVADRGNGRIVAFTKEGEFRFQVRAEALEAVQDLFVDEGQGRLYFTSGQKVFAAPISLPKP